MKLGWERLNLGQLCKVQSGNSNTQDAVADGPYVFFDRSRTPKRSSRYLFDCEALVVAGEGSEFRPKKANGKFDLHQRAYAIHEFGDRLLRDFLFYYLEHVHEYFQGIAVGATVKSLRQRHFENLVVVVPPLDEQKRIVAKLDQAFAALDRVRENAVANLADAEAVFEQTLLSIFDGLLSNTTMMPLAEAAIDFSRGKSKHRPRNDPALYEGAYPFIQTGDVRQAQGTIREFSQTYNEFGLAQSKLWPVGTVCITIAANIAETGVLGMEACFPDSVIGMVPDPKSATPCYVEYMLRYFSKELKLKGKGSAQDNINLATFEGAMFPFPSLAQQNAIVEKLDALAESVSTLHGSYTRALEEVAALRQSLLQAAFSGQLT
ncbi:restriction endonuclease subunit S [Pseudoxanthomonas mexicana]